MAQTQDTSVARAVFTASLLRSEPSRPEISREDAAQFAKQLHKTCNLCSRANIKLCSQFIKKYILGSTLRTTALEKYLVAISKSFCPRDLSKRVNTANAGDENEGLGQIVKGRIQQPPQPAFKRLHAVYILHDVLLHLHTHLRALDRASQDSFRDILVDSLRPTISTMIELAACAGKDGKTLPQLQTLLTIWKQTGILAPEHVEQLQQRMSTAEGLDWDDLLSKQVKESENEVVERLKEKAEEGKGTLPYRHGVIDDPSAPWHELPAVNGLYLKRTRGYPLRAYALPQGGFKLRNGGREADATLQKDVENLVTEVERCYDKYTDPEEVQDIDPLGNIIWKDPDRPTRNYWGFTLDGIERRKELGRRFAENAKGYDDVPYVPMRQINDDVERARALAAERARGRGGGAPRGRGGFGRGGWQPRGRGRGGW